MNRNDLLTLAQRLREYNHNPHHINPVSESFHTLIKDSADALSAVAKELSALKAQQAKSRAKGRGGWDDPAQCSAEFLAKLLIEHLTKGNAGTFEDVANFAMMLHQRGADPLVLPQPAPPAQSDVQRLREALRSAEKDAARYRWLRDGCDHKTSTATHIASSCYGLEWDAAIDTAMKGSSND